MTSNRKQKLRRRRLPVLAGAVAMALAGCTVLPGEKPLPRLFVLTPKSTFDADLPKADWQLTIGKPVAEAGLSTARIALRHNPVTLEYFARANWIDTAPMMVQTLIVESFENTGKIVAVGRESVSLRADYRLIAELREFQAEYSGASAPTVRVRINAKLVRMPQREIIATVTDENRVAAKDASMQSIVQAFDAALGKTLKRLVQWTLRTAPPKQRRR